MGLSSKAASHSFPTQQEKLDFPNSDLSSSNKFHLAERLNNGTPSSLFNCGDMDTARENAML
jgi:hypothetical protein